MPASETLPRQPGASMPDRRPGIRAPRPRVAGVLLAVLALIAAACGGSASPAPAGSPSASAAGASSASPALSPTPSAPVKLVVGLGYIPNVQFAQFYLADQAGYYRDAGLQVEFQNKIDPELVTLVGQGAVDVGISDGTSVIPAVSQGIPIRYVFTVFAQFPNVVFSKATSGIATVADLRGRKVGIPGKFGSSWIQLEALLAEVGEQHERRVARAVPRLRPARGAPAGRGRCRDWLREQRAGPAGAWRAEGQRARPATSQPAARPGSDRERGRAEWPQEGRPPGVRGSDPARHARHRGRPGEGRRRGNCPGPGAGDEPTRAARGPAGDDRALGERLHARERHGRGGSGALGAFDRVHGWPARQAPREAGRRDGLHQQRAAARTLIRGVAQARRQVDAPTGSVGASTAGSSEDQAEALASGRSAGTAASSSAATSSSMAISSDTSQPPVSRPTFQVRPQSERLIFVVASKPA